MAEIESLEDFDKKVKRFRKLVNEKTYGCPVWEEVLQSSMDCDNELKFSYRDLEAYASNNGINLQSHLAEKGIIRIMWYDQPVPRPDVDSLLKWEAKIGRVPIDDLRAQNKDAKIVEFEEEFRHVIRQDKLATISMLEIGDSVEFNLAEELIYFCEKSIGLFKTDKPNLAEFIREPSTYGIIGKVYAEIASVKRNKDGDLPLFTLHIYYAIDEAKSRVKKGLLLSEDGKSIVRCIDDVSDLVIPEGVERIEDKVFMNCSVASVKFSESLRYIGDRAFDGTCLRSIVVPKGIAHIGVSPFTFGTEDKDRSLSYAKVDSPTYVVVEEGNEKYFSRGGSLFERSENGVSLVTLYYQFATTSPGRYSYRIPDDVTHLKEGCIILPWGRHTNGTCDVVLPSGVKRVDKDAIFYGVRVLNIPESLEFGQEEIWNRISEAGRTDANIAAAIRFGDDGSNNDWSNARRSLATRLDKGEYRDFAVSENSSHYFRSREFCFMHSSNGYETTLVLDPKDSVTVKVEDLDQLSSMEKSAVTALKPNDVVDLQLMPETKKKHDGYSEPSFKREVKSLSLRVFGLYDIGSIPVESLFGVEGADANDLQAAIDNLDCRVENVEVTPNFFGLENNVSLSVVVKKAVN